VHDNIINNPDLARYLVNFKQAQITKTPMALAEAMSLAMSEISGQVMFDIYTVILSTGTQ
jgi:hypothetical protein